MPHLFDRDGAGRRIETPAAQYHVFKYEQPLLALGVVVPVRIEAGRRREGEPTCQFLVETRLIDACVAAHVVARPVRLQTKTLGKAGLGTGTVGHGDPRLCRMAGNKLYNIEFIYRDFRVAVAQYPRKTFRSEEHTSELQSLISNSYAVF